MKSNSKKNLIGSLVAFFLGTSCCWISSLAIWLGGATILSTFAAYLEKTQYVIIGVGVFLGLLSLFLFLKNR